MRQETPAERCSRIQNSQSRFMLDGGRDSRIDLDHVLSTFLRCRSGKLIGGDVLPPTRVCDMRVGCGSSFVHDLQSCSLHEQQAMKLRFTDHIAELPEPEKGKQG